MSIVNFINYEPGQNFFETTLVKHMENEEDFDGNVYVNIKDNQLVDFMKELKDYNYKYFSVYTIRPTIWPDGNQYILTNEIFNTIDENDYLIFKGVRRAALLVTDVYMIDLIAKYLKVKYPFNDVKIYVLDQTEAETEATGMISFVLYKNDSTEKMLQVFNKLTEDVEKEAILGAILGYDPNDCDEFLKIYNK